MMTNTFNFDPNFRDIRDRDGGRNIYITPIDNSWWVVLSVSVIIIIAAWIFLIFLSIESIPQSFAQGNGGTVLVSCPINQCAVNRFNGEKRCPPAGAQTVSNAAIELCSNPTICDNILLPYAVQSDDSTNPQGSCEPGVTCRCLPRPQCANYIMSVFKTSTGNPYSAIVGQRLAFTQAIASDPDKNVTDAAGNITVSDNSPISYDDNGQTFCTIPSDWIAISTPGCGFLNSGNISVSDMTTCMSGPNANCGQTLFNPCARGTLAFVTDDSTNFNSGSIDSTPLGCVAGEGCSGCNEIAIYDTKYGNIVCKVVTP